MPCTNPLKAWNGGITKNGRSGLVFKRPMYGSIEPDHWLPCGKCLDCKLDYGRQWAIRCLHEKKMHERSCFITLTYDNNNLPNPPTVAKEELQKFFKRLRKKLVKEKIRYFACGEYGSQNFRPHYHAIIFGYMPSDGIIARS